MVRKFRSSPVPDVLWQGDPSDVRQPSLWQIVLQHPVFLMILLIAGTAAAVRFLMEAMLPMAMAIVIPVGFSTSICLSWLIVQRHI